MLKTKTKGSRASKGAEIEKKPNERRVYAFRTGRKRLLKRKKAEKALKMAEKRPKTTPKRDKNGRVVTKHAPNDLAMKRFIENVPDDEFTKALEAAEDPKIALVLKMHADPAYWNESFASLCRRANVSLRDVDDLWRNHQLHRGMVRMMTHVPEILEDVAVDAKSREVVCHRCCGETKITDDDGKQRPCPVCNETGRVRQVGDKNARDLVFESLSLTGKRAPMVAIQQNFGLDAQLEDVLMSTQKMITGSNDEPA